MVFATVKFVCDSWWCSWV